jgi:hypothetical protein
MKNKNILISTAIFAVSLIVYLITLNPSIAYTDSGELATACVSLGVGHPTGYPLFIILGHLWTYLPISNSPIYELNVFAAFLTSMSAVVFFLTLNLLLDFFKTDKNIKDIISVSGSLVYAFAATVWEQSNSIEVYSLQLLLFNLIIYFTLSAKFKNNYRIWLLAALSLGLGFSNHMTTVLTLPALIFIYFKNLGKVFDFSEGKFGSFLYLLIPLLIGASVYLYLPIRSSMEPELNWGWVHRGFDKFMYQVQGKQYQVWMFQGSEVMKQNFSKFFIAVPNEISFLGLFSALFGLWFLIRKSSVLFWFILILIFSCLFYSVNYSIHDIESYFSLAFIGLLLLSVIGFLEIIKINKNLVYLIILLPIFNFSLNYKDCDESKNYLVYDYTKTMIDNLEPNAILISAQWDYMCSAFWYMQRIEGYRKDVTLIEKELMRRTWMPYQLKKWYPSLFKPCESNLSAFTNDLEKFESGRSPKTFPGIQENFTNLFRCIIESNFDKKPIYITADILESDPAIVRGYNLYPEGLAIRVRPDTSTKPIIIDNIKFARFIESSKHIKTYLDSGITQVASMSFANLGRYALISNDIESAKKAFTTAVKINPTNMTALEALDRIGK